MEARPGRSVPARASQGNVRLAPYTRVADMSAADTAERLTQILRREGLDDPAWIESLDEHDEPPLFSRAADLEFLRNDPAREIIVLGWAIGALDRTRTAIERTPDPSRYFLCLTFLDWELVAEGMQVVPTPSLLVSPDVDREFPRFRVRPPVSPEARRVSGWLAKIPREDLCVRDDVRPEAEPRVYLGYCGPHVFKSLGDFNVGPL